MKEDYGKEKAVKSFVEKIFDLNIKHLKAAGCKETTEMSERALKDFLGKPDQSDESSKRPD